MTLYAPIPPLHRLYSGDCRLCAGSSHLFTLTLHFELKVSLLLILIPSSEVALGQASFLILIGALLSPPNEPLAAILRREFNILVAVLCSWAWSCLGMKLAFLARSIDFGTIDKTLIFKGAYVEFGVSRWNATSVYSTTS